MNLGNIPGFYYDDEKKKYFKIQPNHLAPENAKYSKGRVVQEHRINKRQNRDKKVHTRRFAQTIRPPPVLRSAIGRIGLVREHGTSRNTNSLVDSAFVSHCLPQTTTLNFPRRLNDATLISSSRRILLTSTRENTGKLSVCEWSWRHGDMPSTPLAAFNSPISTLSTTLYQDDQRVVACASDFQNGNIFAGSAAEDNGVYLTIGAKNSSITASSFNRATGSAVILGTSHILVLDPMAQSTDILKLEAGLDCSPAVQWLDRNTIVYSQHRLRHWDGDLPALKLWDSRTSDGTSIRFRLAERVTGILCPETEVLGGNQVLVATNHHIQLLDTRMHHRRQAVPTRLKAGVLEVDTPILSFRHTHGRPQSRWCVGGVNSSLIGAADVDDIIQIYAMRTGEHIGSLPGDRRPSYGGGLSSLSWLDDIDSYDPAFVGVYSGNRGAVRKWEWGGPNDDE